LHLPQDLPELQRRIIAAISEISRDMLQQVWAKMAYQLDICLVTVGSVRFLFTIQVYQFCEMCQGILNNPVHQIVQ
jgi:hypothetical protein